jgi:hypothetical protein
MIYESGIKERYRRIRARKHPMDRAFETIGNVIRAVLGVALGGLLVIFFLALCFVHPVKEVALDIISAIFVMIVVLLFLGIFSGD